MKLFRKVRGCNGAVFLFTAFLVCSPAFGQTNIEIFKYPDIDTIVVGEGPNRIAMIAMDDTPYPKYEWKIIKGSGDFDAKDKDFNKPGIFYQPPTQIQNPEERIEIALEISGQDGNVVKKGKASFTLKTPLPKKAFKIESVRLINERDRTLVPVFSVTAGEKLKINVTTPELFEKYVDIKCSSEWGEIQDLKYTTPKQKDKDAITCKAKHKETNETSQFIFLVDVTR